MAILGTTDLGDGRLFVTVDHDPTSTATDALTGSIVFSTSTASHYTKDDDGSTTNVTLFRVSVLHGVILVTATATTSFATIALAIAAASSGDTIWLGPGSYAESFTLPAGVHLRGIANAAAVIAGAAAGGTRVTLNDGSLLDGVGVTMPNDAFPVITYGGTGTATVRGVTLTGGGALGIGIRNTSTGNLVVKDLTYASGVAASAVSVTAGLVTLDGIKALGGTLTDMVSATGGELIGHNWLIETAATVTDAFEVGAASVDVTVAHMTGQTNSVHVTSNSAVVHLRSALLEATAFDLLVDGGLTSGELHFVAVHMLTSQISAPGAWLTGADVVLTVQETDQDDAAWHIWGELHVGTPEVPREAALGGGDSYTRGMVVLTTDSTASASVDGGNLTDVSTAAQSPTGSTFSFQGTAAGHAILVGSSLEDAVGVLKHWGWKTIISTAGSTNGTYLIDIWDGAAWVEVEVMAIEADLFHRYGNILFLRGPNEEHLRFGLTADTTWATKNINGSTLYWIRVRITSAPTVAPVFERFKLSTSRMEINPEGTFTAHGRSRWKETLLAAGNVFGESGGVIDSTVTVGSGGIPTGWNHAIKNSLINQGGDAIYFQFVLPRGIDTSLPLEFHITYNVDANTTIQMILSVLPQEVSGVLVADPAGGIPALARTEANTDALTANAGTADTFNLPTTTTGKVHRVTRSGFDISDYYEGDIVWVRLELDDDGVGNADVQIVTIEVGGVRWTLGESQ